MIRCWRADISDVTLLVSIQAFASEVPAVFCKVRFLECVTEYFLMSWSARTVDQIINWQRDDRVNIVLRSTLLC